MKLLNDVFSLIFLTNKKHLVVFFIYPKAIAPLMISLYTYPMNIDDQKLKLVEEKKNLEKDLDLLGNRDANGGWLVVPDEDDGTHADPIDNADTTEDFEEKIARLNVLEAQHAQIQKALDAIENGTYGICEVSGEIIPENRMMANPSATTTVEHAK